MMHFAVIALTTASPLTLANPAPPEDRTGSITMQSSTLYAPISSFLESRAGEFDQIDEPRKTKLKEVSDYISAQLAAKLPVRLNFVCTHNSRRSHMSQLWAAAAAESLGIPLTTYSGGTEDTAFNPRAVAAMERAGFKIDKTTDARNPIYHVRMGDEVYAMTCFSKAYDNPPNPRDGFAAIMVCNDADEKCPFVNGANGRFAIPFVDPKVSDDTPQESATYDERCAQIAREMLFIMSNVRR